MKTFFRVALILSFFGIIACTGKSESKPEVWVYTSLYKDTIADIEPVLQKQMPEYKINFYQAGSEELSAKINAELLAGGTKADVVLFSDPFWYDEMATKGLLHKYSPKGSETVSAEFKSGDGQYMTASLPLMVLAYNNEAVKESEAPKTFKDLSDPKWKSKFTTGNPLESGTNFTTVALLQKRYGWDYFKALRKNETISNGGNSAVLRRIQTKERPIGWVLLENILRFVDKDPHLKTIVPEDGAVLQTNTLAIIKKDGTRAGAEKFCDWLISREGQQYMVKSFMYSVLPGFEAPKGAPELTGVLAKAQKWTAEDLKAIAPQREKIKEEFTKIMLQ